ncbi:MAG: cobalamin-dependent protein [Pirellula sp.]|jgi:excisionase family DNA binding protein|nr:cobalamin-dependent protein [Pirellula sp.]
MKLLTTQQAARLLGIGVSSVKRLCADNQLSEIRTPGGHRRISSESVFELAKNRSIESLPSARNVEFLLTPQSLIERLLRGELFSLKQLIESLLMQQSLAKLFDDLIAPSFWQLGKLCGLGELEIYKCFVASSRMKEILLWIRQTVETRVSMDRLLANREWSPGFAVGACMGDEMHDVASLMVEITLIEHGYSTLNLGCCVPVDSVIRAARDRQASVVWTSYSLLGNLSNVVQENHSLFSAVQNDAKLLVGGAALTSRIRSLMRYSCFLEGMTQLSEWVQKDSKSIEQAY